MLFEQAAYLYIQDKTEGRKPVRPIEAVSLMLGHSDISMAYQHYLCANVSLLRDSQRSFGVMLASAW